MAMRNKNKSTSWKYDGRRGKKMSRRYANILERNNAKKEIEKELENKTQ